MTVSETAERLRVSEKTVRRLANGNDLPTLSVGGSVCVDAGELERWLGQQLSAMGGSFVAPNGAAMGRSNVVGDPAERATGPRPALFPASFDPSRRGKWTVPSSGGK
jgi:excisionase family DNA binding protein